MVKVLQAGKKRWQAAMWADCPMRKQARTMPTCCILTAQSKELSTLRARLGALESMVLDHDKAVLGLMDVTTLRTGDSRLQRSEGNALALQ